MATLLCASCRYSFPSDMLEPASFNSRTGRCLGLASQLLRDTQGRRGEDDHRLTQVRQMLQQLSGLIEEEVQQLQARPVTEHRIGTAGRHAHATNKQYANDFCQYSAMSTHHRDSPATTMNGTTTRAATTRFQLTAASTMDRGGSATAAPLKTFDGAVLPCQMRRTVSAFDLVSATLYNVLESVAVQCRASVALLWLRPRLNISAEMVAPFVVGRELTALANSAPYSTPESSVPCLVCQTGVALNLQPLPSRSTSSKSNMEALAAGDVTLTELMEQTNAAQLLIPVHDRYVDRSECLRNFPITATTAANGNAAGFTTPSKRGSATPATAADGIASSASPSAARVLAVLHLIGSPKLPVPFHRHNEEAAAQTAALLSYVLSSYYEKMIAEWANRFYVPTTLLTTGKYAARLDMRPDEKALDDFAASPLLILRCAVGDSSGPQSTNETRDALKLLQHQAQRRSAPLRPMATVKDLCQHAATMEANWVSAMQRTARLEKEVAALEDDAMHRDMLTQQSQQNRRSGGAEVSQRSLISSPNRTFAASQPLDRVRHGPRTPRKNGQTATAASPLAHADEVVSSSSYADVAAALTPATSIGAAAASGGGIMLPPLCSDVLVPEEVERLEMVTLRRLKTLGVDTSLFERFS